MSQFSINRLMMLLRWNNAASKKMVRSMTIGMTIAISGFTLTNFMGSFFDHTPVDESAYVTVGGFLAIMVFLMFFAGLTRVCYNMRTKSEMSNYMLLPATKTEKLIAASLTQIIATACAFVFAVILADAMQVVFSLLFTKTVTGSLVVTAANLCWQTVTAVVPAFFHEMLGFFTISNLFLNLCAACLLCGCFFRRHQTIWTVAVIVGMPILFSFVSGILMSFIIDNPMFVDFLEDLTYVDNDVLIALYNIFVLATTIFMLWLSHRIYSRMQLMTNRFFNW